MKYTIDDIMALHPCYRYSRDTVSGLFAGRDALTLDEIAALNIAPKDIVWCLCVLIKPDTQLTHIWVERAIRRAMTKPSLPKAWIAWANNWLNDTDRTSARASDAAYAAADATAADATAYAYAATAAAYAAYAATAATAAAYAATAANVAHNNERKQQIIELLDYAKLEALQ